VNHHFQHPVPYGVPTLIANPVGSAVGAGIAAGIGAGLGALAAWATGRDVRQWAYYGAAGGAGLSLVSNAFAQDVPRVSMDTYPAPVTYRPASGDTPPQARPAQYLDPSLVERFGVKGRVNRLLRG